MDSKPMHHIALVTAPSMEVARELAEGILEGRLAACANLVSGIESHYWWEGEICQEKEVLLILKTSAGSMADLESYVIEHHPYDTPEFVAWPIDKGNQKYLHWISMNTARSE